MNKYINKENSYMFDVDSQQALSVLSERKVPWVSGCFIYHVDQELYWIRWKTDCNL